jgi:hypothetical protein
VSLVAYLLLQQLLPRAAWLQVPAHMSCPVLLPCEEAWGPWQLGSSAGKFEKETRTRTWMCVSKTLRHASQVQVCWGLWPAEQPRQQHDGCH